MNWPGWRQHRCMADRTKPVDGAALEGNRDLVQGRIRAAILAGRWAPRQRLIEGELSEQFGASRFVIQDRASRTDWLQTASLALQRNRNAHVREVNLHEAVEITQVRRLIEGLVAAQAALRITPGRARSAPPW
jgi:DNA-binding GntR family transcriptional regulator